MRSQFDKQLETLHIELIKMGSLCEEAISLAVKMLGDGEASLSDRIHAAEAEIDREEREIENICMRLLLRQQPVARDLRNISAALKMISDMERIGDQADSVEAFVKGDLNLARRVMKDDDRVDALFEQIKNELMKVIARGDMDAKASIDLLMAAKYFERIGDHAVNVAEWVEYSITGVHAGGEESPQM